MEYVYYFFRFKLNHISCCNEFAFILVLDVDMKNSGWSRVLHRFLLVMRARSIYSIVEWTAEVEQRRMSTSIQKKKNWKVIKVGCLKGQGT
jgi:hypothetical protein